jgi:hypothetical protein
MPMPRLHPLLALALAAGLGLPVTAHAELVVLTDGQYLKVKAYETDGEQAMLTLVSGGRMRLPIGRVERVIDDEVLPAPDPLPVAAVAVLAVPPAIELGFDDSQPVPEGPYGTLIYETARRHELNPRVVAALIRAESANRPKALSHKGARGLMQLMPATAHRFGVRKEHLYDPAKNLEAGTRYLRWLTDRFPGDLARILAAYNAGEGAVERYGGIPPYRETREYVRRIFTTLGLSLTELSFPTGKS